MSLLKNNALTETHVEALGEFIARVHDQGIYFRGLHLGNIILTPSGQLGLIDISEMTISPFRLSAKRRHRNFERFWRKKEDQYSFGERNIEVFSQNYSVASKKVQMSAKIVRNTLASS